MQPHLISRGTLTRVLVSTLLAGSLFTALAGRDEFLGRWALTIPGGGAGWLTPGIVTDRTAAADAGFPGSGLARLRLRPRRDVASKSSLVRVCSRCWTVSRSAANLRAHREGPSCMPTWCFKKSVRSTVTRYRTVGARSTMLSNL